MSLLGLVVAERLGKEGPVRAHCVRGRDRRDDGRDARHRHREPQDDRGGGPPDRPGRLHGRAEERVGHPLQQRDRGAARPHPAGRRAWRARSGSCSTPRSSTPRTHCSSRSASHPKDLTPFGVQVLAGPSFGATARQPDDARLAHRAKTSACKPGDTLTSRAGPKMVTGIFSTGNVFGDSAGMFPLVPFQAYERQPGGFSLVFVKVRRARTSPAVKKRVGNDEPEPHHDPHLRRVRARRPQLPAHHRGRHAARRSSRSSSARSS